MTTPEDAPASEEDRVLGLARALARLGKTDRAIAQYDNVLALQPGSADAFVEVVGLLEAADDWRGIARRCETWIADQPDHASHVYSDRVHNLRIDALCRIGGMDLAFDAYGLQQLTDGPVELRDGELVAVVATHDEERRLPFLLDHHRRLGVDRFLCIDNASDDRTVELLLAEPDTVVWQTHGSYRGANCGAAWFDLVLRRHACGQWCLIVDADELFVYPGYEEHSLHDLCADLERHGATCYGAILLDMYSEARLSDIQYRQGQDPLEVFPYFDRAFYRRRAPFKGPRRNMTNYWGGVRARIFGGELSGYLLQKFPLLRYSPGEVLMSGQHWLDRPTAEIATGRGALLHFKLDAAFPRGVVEEVARMEHANRARAYRNYAATLATHPDPTFFDPVHSVRYEGSRQLVEIGVMRDGGSTQRVRVAAASVPVPSIPPVSSSSAGRPFWSVVVVAGPDRARDLDRVERVIGALGAGPPSEVVVVVPAGTADPDALLAANPSERHSVAVVTTEQFLTDVEAANLGLRNARGAWVHVLGSDHAVSSACYGRFAEAVDGASAALAVTTPEPFQRGIDLDFALSPARFVARRELYERVGGFCATVAAAAAWELLQRLAAASPAAPVQVRSGCSEPVVAGAPMTAMGFGEDVIHWLAAIDLAHEALHLTESDVTALHDRCAVRAADLVRDDIAHGRFGSALATACEALRVPVSAAAREHLIDEVRGSL